jgi:hypothetical protein
MEALILLGKVEFERVKDMMQLCLQGSSTTRDSEQYEIHAMGFYLL